VYITRQLHVRSPNRYGAEDCYKRQSSKALEIFELKLVLALLADSINCECLAEEEGFEPIAVIRWL
jgi:hypothetical protein